MRFNVGPIPPTPAFAPELGGGWQRLHEPSPALYQLLALPVAIAALLVLLKAWAATLPGPLHEVYSAAWVALPVFVAIIPVHEFVHALCHPHWGRSSSTIYGVWPKKLLFYARYDGELPRNRLIGILLAPTLVLSCAPVLLAAFTGAGHWLVVLATLINALAASGDLTGALLLATQVPVDATVRNQGYDTWWRRERA